MKAGTIPASGRTFFATDFSVTGVYGPPAITSPAPADPAAAAERGRPAAGSDTGSTGSFAGGADSGPATACSGAEGADSGSATAGSPELTPT